MYVNNEQDLNVAKREIQIAVSPLYLVRNCSMIAIPEQSQWPQEHHRLRGLQSDGDRGRRVRGPVAHALLSRKRLWSYEAAWQSEFYGTRSSDYFL